MAIYVALTTTNPQSGSRPVAHGFNRARVQELAREVIGNADIYAQTEQRNLVVVPLSRVRGNARRDMDHALDSIQELALRIKCQTRHLRALANDMRGYDVDGDRVIERDAEQTREDARDAAFALDKLAAACGAEEVRRDRLEIVRAIGRSLQGDRCSLSTDLADYFA